MASTSKKNDKSISNEKKTYVISPKDAVSSFLVPTSTTYDKDAHRIEYRYNFHAKELSRAFSALREYTEKNSLTPSTLTMQKFPELATVRKKIKKTDSEGNPVYSEKKTVKHSDVRWVLSFDWKTQDPADARTLEYCFYDNGWPGSVSFIIAKPDEIALAPRDEKREEPMLFECSFSFHDNPRARELADSLAEILSAYDQKKEGE